MGIGGSQQVSQTIDLNSLPFPPFPTAHRRGLVYSGYRIELLVDFSHLIEGMTPFNSGVY